MRFMSMGHLLVVVVNLPKIQIDQPSTSESSVSMNDWLTFEVYLPSIIVSFVCHMVFTALSILAFWFINRRINMNARTQNLELVDQSTVENGGNSI